MPKKKRTARQTTSETEGTNPPSAIGNLPAAKQVHLKHLQDTFASQIDPDVVYFVLVESDYNVDAALESLFMLSEQQQQHPSKSRDPESGQVQSVSELDTFDDDAASKTRRQNSAAVAGFMSHDRLPSTEADADSSQAMYLSNEALYTGDGTDPIVMLSDSFAATDGDANCIADDGSCDATYDANYDALMNMKLSVSSPSDSSLEADASESIATSQDDLSDMHQSDSCEQEFFADMGRGIHGAWGTQSTQGIQGTQCLVSNDEYPMLPPPPVQRVMSLDTFSNESVTTDSHTQSHTRCHTEPSSNGLESCVRFVTPFVSSTSGCSKTSVTSNNTATNSVSNAGSNTASSAARNSAWQTPFYPQPRIQNLTLFQSNSSNFPPNLTNFQPNLPTKHHRPSSFRFSINHSPSNAQQFSQQQPRNQISDHLQRRKRVLIILRGLPGSGKTTLAQSLKCTGIVLSTDDYFHRNGQYNYDVTQLSEAHEWNQLRAKHAMAAKVSPVIIDNTNTQMWEMKPYVLLGCKYKYAIDIFEPDTSWKFKPRELAVRNVHNVCKERIKLMLERYEYNVTVDSILKSSKVERLKRDESELIETQSLPCLTVNSGHSPRSVSGADKVEAPVLVAVEGVDAKVAVDDESLLLQCVDEVVSGASIIAASPSKTGSAISVAQVKKDCGEEVRYESEGSGTRPAATIKARCRSPQKKMSRHRHEPGRESTQQFSCSSSKSTKVINTFPLYSKTEISLDDWNEVIETCEQNVWVNESNCTSICSTQNESEVSKIWSGTGPGLPKNNVGLSLHVCSSGIDISESVISEKCDTSVANDDDAILVAVQRPGDQIGLGLESITCLDVNEGYNGYKLRENVVDEEVSVPDEIMGGEIMVEGTASEKNSTDEDVTNIGFLSTCFPSVSADTMNEIIEKCAGNDQWAADLLLEISESNEPLEVTEWLKNLDLKKSNATNCNNTETAAAATESVDVMVTRSCSFDCFDKLMPSKAESPVRSRESPVNFRSPTRAPSSPNRATSLPPGVDEFDGDTCLPAVQLRLDRNFASCLQELFGPVGFKPLAEYSSDDFTINVDSNLAWQIHQAWAQTLKTKTEAEDTDFEKSYVLATNDSDAQYAKKLQEEEDAHLAESLSVQNSPSTNFAASKDSEIASLKEIMDLEMALQISKAEVEQQLETRIAKRDIATKLKRQKLGELFPSVDKMALDEIFTAHNFSLVEAVESLKGQFGNPSNPSSEILANYEALVNNTAKSEYLQDTARRPQALMKPLDFPTENGEEDFRGEANLHYQMRNQCFQKAQAAYNKGMKAIASFYSQQGHLHTEKMWEANRRASTKILVHRNIGRDKNTLDLHLLYVKEAVVVLDEYLKQKEELLAKKGERKLTVSIITGRGSHSANKVPRVKVAVIDYLKRNNYSFNEVHAGLLQAVVTLRNKCS